MTSGELRLDSKGFREISTKFSTTEAVAGHLHKGPVGTGPWRKDKAVPQWVAEPGFGCDDGGVMPLDLGAAPVGAAGCAGGAGTPDFTL